MLQMMHQETGFKEKEEQGVKVTGKRRKRPQDLGGLEVVNSGRGSLPFEGIW